MKLEVDFFIIYDFKRICKSFYLFLVIDDMNRIYELCLINIFFFSLIISFGCGFVR